MSEIRRPTLPEFAETILPDGLKLLPYQKRIIEAAERGDRLVIAWPHRSRRRQVFAYMERNGEG